MTVTDTAPEADTSTDVDTTEDTPDTGDDTATGGENPDDDNAETFPASVVRKLRDENARHRQRAAQADAYAARLHTALVAATGRLADPSDLPFDAAHLDEDGGTEALTTAIDALLADKPHLASRRPVGDIGQGNRGGASEPFSLLGMLKDRT